MTDLTPGKNKVCSPKGCELESPQARALRDNLARRKEQRFARQESQLPPEFEESSEESSSDP